MRPASGSSTELQISRIDLGTSSEESLHDFPIATLRSEVKWCRTLRVSGSRGFRMAFQKFAHAFDIPDPNRGEQRICELTHN